MSPYTIGSVTFTGTAGGSGGAGNATGGGGGGGSGGAGLIAQGTATVVLNSGGGLAGGSGGAGGASPEGAGGAGGSGGIGLVYRNSGVLSLAAGSTITGGAGGAGGSGGTSAGANGAGGVGIQGSGLTINTSGTISGGFSGDGVTRANALSLLGGSNTLNFGNATSGLNGNVDIASGGSLQMNAASSGTTVANTITGAGTLSVGGSNTLVLTGTNTYTGLTFVNSGTLALLASGSIAQSARVVVNAGSVFDIGSTTGGATIKELSGGGVVTLGMRTLTVDAATMSTFGGIILGSGGLTKTGGSLFALTGNSSYSGATTIVGGTLAANSSAALGDGSATNTLIFNGGTLRATGTISSPSDRGVTLTGAGSIEVDGFNNVFINGTITGAGALTKTGSGALILAGANSYSGTTTIQAGSLGVSSSAALGDGSATNTLIFQDGGILYATGVVSSPASRDVILNGTSTFNVNGNSMEIAGSIRGTGALFKTGVGTLTLTGNNTYSGTTTVRSGRSDALAVDSSEALGDGSATNTLIFEGSFSTLRAIGNIVSPTARGVTLAGGGNIDTNGYAVEIAGAINGGDELYKTGTGTLTLKGSNLYSGATTVTAGVLNVQNASALGTTASGTTVAAGAALQLQGDIAIGAEALTLSGFGINRFGALRNLSGDNSYGGAITLAGDSIIRSDIGSLTLDGTINGTGPGYSLVLDGPGDITIVGALGSNIINLVKDIDGTLTLEGTSAHVGTTTVRAGALALSGTGSIAQSSGVEVSAGSTFDISSTTVGATIKGLAGEGSVVLDAQTLTVDGIGSSTFSGSLFGSGGLIKTGGGTLRLTGDNAIFSGTTTIQAGVLEIGSLNALGNGGGTNTLIFDGGTLRAGISFASPSTRGVTLTGAGTIDTNGDDVSIDGVVEGAGTLTKTGSGTLTLTGTNTYSGATTVRAGTLIVTGSPTGTGAIGVAADAAFGGTGSVAGVLTVAGTISAGESALSEIGTLATKTLALTGAGAVFRQDVAGPASAGPASADRITVTGAVTLAGTLDLHTTGASFAASIGQSLVFIANDEADTVGGRFAQLALNNAPAFTLANDDTFIIDGRSYRIDYRAGDGNDVAIRDVTPAPQPPTSPVTPPDPTPPTPQPPQPPEPTRDTFAQFGSFVTDPASPAGGVYALYEALLNRAPDRLGLESFTTALQYGASLTDVANALLASPERGMGAGDPAAYVQSLYQNLLDRQADPSGLATFTNALAAGASPAEVAVQNATSAEARNVLAPTFAPGVFVPDASESSVARLYHGLLERAPDEAGLRGFSAFIETGGNGAGGEAARLGQVATAILASPEYAATHPGLTDAAFVFELYRDALGRAPDAGGQAGYLAALSQGASRMQVALDITQSPEAQTHLVGLIQDGALLVA